MNNSDGKNTGKSNKRFIAPVISLAVICMSVGLLLSTVHGLTREKIEENLKAAERSAIAEVYGLSGERASEVEYTALDGCPDSVNAVYAVIPPVTALTLSYKGKASPGKTVTITPIFEPKKPGNSAVEWSVNVGEDVATISNKGALKISKDAAPGTVITVTCKALGAPEPVVMTIDVPVE